MDSDVEVVAVLGRDGATVLRTIRAHGSLAVRRTGPARVHLVGAAAGPLGGDLVRIRLRVGAGAALAVRSAAATIALPGRDGGVGRLVLETEIEDRGLLECALEPLVVCREAVVHSRTRVGLAGSGRLQLVGQVVLGRHGEQGGRWTGRITVDRDGHPVLRQSTDSTVVAAEGSTVRAVVTSLDTAPVIGATGCAPGWIAATAGDAVACPLHGGGMLVCATGPDLSRALADQATALHHAIAACRDRLHAHV